MAGTRHNSPILEVFFLGGGGIVQSTTIDSPDD